MRERQKEVGDDAKGSEKADSCCSDDSFRDCMDEDMSEVMSSWWEEN